MVIEPQRVFTIHLAIIAGFALANVPIVVMDALGHHQLFGYARLMRLEEEANLPTMFSAVALLCCATAAGAVRSRLRQDDRDRAAWGLLSLFFVFLATDEAVMLHEIGNRISDELSLGGVLSHFGVFVYVPLLLWLAFRLFGFWLRQEPGLRAALALAAALFVAAAMGFELVENELIALGMKQGDTPLQLAFIAEDLGEMLAGAVFLRAFLRQFALLGGGPLVPLTVRPARETADRDEPSAVQNRPVSSSP